MIVFKEIAINGLFGETDIKIPVIDNRIILVGYNGIGKSTILNIFYYFISQQWHKLSEQDFISVSLRLKNRNRKLTITRSELPEYLEYRRRDRRFSGRYIIRSGALREAYELLFRDIGGRPQDSSKRLPNMSFRQARETLRKELGIPASMADDLVHEVFTRSSREFDFGPESDNNISQVDEFLSEHLKGRILYLPTYRRIEKDIKTVFPEVEDELRRKLSRRGYERASGDSYIELVQFGMEDVKENMSARLDGVKAYALAQINDLTTKYLRDVIRNEASQYEETQKSQISDAALNSVFSKVDSEVLNDKDKEKIAEVVEKIRKGERLLENEKYVAHYVLYLVDVGNNIAVREQPILQFVETCNSYLYGKSFLFDNVSYQVRIIHDSGRPVEMEELSSGEKQIVSLFSHLLLDQDVLNYIVIDEPELSLSVDWQQRFLEDISKLSTCAFIGAVTHSPFIFENSLDAHTIDLLEYATPSQ